MRRLWITPLLFGLGALIAGAGCNANPVLLIAYLLDDGEPKSKAEFPLKPKTKNDKEPVKVLVLASCTPSVSPDMPGVDRAVAAEFIRMLQERCTENKENVLIKKASAVDEFKKKHTEWETQSPYEIGKQLEADYVIDIEIQEISLYKPDTRRQFMQGHAQVHVAVFRCTKGAKDAGAEPVFTPNDYNIEYPPGREVSTFDQHVNTFKQKFIKRIAGELVIPYSEHTSDQKVLLD